jgi:hypothetical protein
MDLDDMVEFFMAEAMAGAMAERGRALNAPYGGILLSIIFELLQILFSRRVLQNVTHRSSGPSISVYGYRHAGPWNGDTARTGVAGAGAGAGAISGSGSGSGCALQ